MKCPYFLVSTSLYLPPQKKKNLHYTYDSVAYKGKGTMTTNSHTKLGVHRYHITRSSILIRNQQLLIRNQQLYIDILMSHSPRINFICHIICVAKISKPRITRLLLSSCFEHCHKFHISKGITETNSN